MYVHCRYAFIFKTWFLNPSARYLFLLRYRSARKTGRGWTVAVANWALTNGEESHTTIYARVSRNIFARRRRWRHRWLWRCPETWFRGSLIQLYPTAHHRYTIISSYATKYFLIYAKSHRHFRGDEGLL